MPGLPIAVVPHPAAEQTPEGIAAYADNAIDEIVHMLEADPIALAMECRERKVATKSRLRYKSVFEGDFNAPGARTLIRAPDSPEAVTRLFYLRGWTDGLPIVPPTPERWEAMLAGRDPAEEIGPIEPRLGMATVGNVAANAVMAGAAPEAMPVLLAATRAMTDPALNLKAVQSTTHPCTVMAIVHGPIAEELDINSGTNCMGQGSFANATIGRAIRFILTNVGGGIPGVMDRATMGTPAKFAFCFAENTAANPWSPLHTDFGFKAADNAVTLFGCEGPHNVNDHYGDHAEEILTTIVSTMSTSGANNAKYNLEYLVVIGPEHAEIMRRDGFSKDDVRRFLYDRAIVPRHMISRAQMNMYRERIHPHRLLGDNGADGVRLVTSPEMFVIAVAGGAGRHSAVIPTFGNTSPVTARIA